MSLRLYPLVNRPVVLRLSNELVIVGYEDFNFVLETAKGKYFVKIFSNFRNDADCKRYVDVMLKAIGCSVSFPELFMSEQGYLYTKKVNDARLRLCVMEHIDGESYFSLGEKPGLKEIKFLARQATLINSMDIKPAFVYDSWAISNFPEEFRQKGRHLLPQDLKTIKPLVEEFKGLKSRELPHRFVHGDLIATNVMKGDKVWVIDFAVSNYYPRIQELAVMACNLLFDVNSRRRSEGNLKAALDEYQKTIKLSSRELEALPTYIKVAHAMHVLRANYEKLVNKNASKENEYFLNEGRMGLEQMP